MQFSSRAAKTRGDGAGRSVRQRHHLLQWHCGLHVHVCREYTATGTQQSICHCNPPMNDSHSASQCFCPRTWCSLVKCFRDPLPWLCLTATKLIAKALKNPSSWSYSQRILTLYLCTKVLTSIRSLPTVCLIVPTVCVPTHGPQLKIVQLLDGRVCWRRVESHYATTYLPLTLIPKGGFSTKHMIRMSHRAWGSEGLMGNLTPSDWAGSPQGQTLALLTVIPSSLVVGKNQLSLSTTK